MLEKIISFLSLYWIIYSLQICSQISSNLVFCSKSTENVCEQWDITEANKWTRLLIFDDKSYFGFSQSVSEQLISLL